MALSSPFSYTGALGCHITNKIHLQFFTKQCLSIFFSVKSQEINFIPRLGASSFLLGHHLPEVAALDASRAIPIKRCNFFHRFYQQSFSDCPFCARIHPCIRGGFQRALERGVTRLGSTLNKNLSLLCLRLNLRNVRIGKMRNC